MSQPCSNGLNWEKKFWKMPLFFSHSGLLDLFMWLFYGSVIPELFPNTFPKKKVQFFYDNFNQKIDLTKYSASIVMNDMFQQQPNNITCLE